MGYRLTVAAAGDLSRIYTDGVHKFGRIQSDRYYEELVDALEFLARFPRAARERKEFSPPVRIHPVKRIPGILRLIAELRPPPFTSAAQGAQAPRNRRNRQQAGAFFERDLAVRTLDAASARLRRLPATGSRFGQRFRLAGNTKRLQTGLELTAIRLECVNMRGLQLTNFAKELKATQAALANCPSILP